MPSIEDVDARTVREQELESGVLTYHVHRVRLVRDALHPAQDELRLRVAVFRHGQPVSLVEICDQDSDAPDRLIRTLILEGRY